MWWSSANDRADDDGGDNESRSPSDLVSEEELDVASNPRKEILEPSKRESNKRDALEIERSKERFSE